MKPQKIIIAVFIVLSIFLFNACKVKEAIPQKPTIFVSILPQAYFVDSLAGDRVNTRVLVGPGQSPHSWEPSPKQIAELSTASIWFTIGVEFEKALKPGVAGLSKNLDIVDTTVGVNYRLLEAHSHEDELETHDLSAERHLEADQHIWLGRQAVKAIITNMYYSLVTLDPAGKAFYDQNKNKLTEEIDKTYDRLIKDFEPLKGSTAFVFHPAFGYLLDDLGLKQEAVETGGKEPTQKSLAELIEKAKSAKAKVIFVQAQFPVGAAKAVAAAVGGTVVAIDPLAIDWLKNLEHIAHEFEKGLR